MIKFFRRIRQKLLEKNSFSKYLIYAIGEIILVVIGILIALQINNWNEFNKDRLTEQKILRQLQKEYKANLAQLDEKIDMRNKMMHASKRMLDFLDKPAGFATDSLLYFMYRISQDPTFDPIANDIINSGKLDFIQNDSLSNMLSNWKSEAYQLQELEIGWQKVRSDNYIPLLIQKGLVRNVISDIFKKGYAPIFALDKNDTIKYSINYSSVDVPKVLLENRILFEGVVTTCIVNVNLANFQSYALRNRIEQILALIKQELKPIND